VITFQCVGEKGKIVPFIKDTFNSRGGILNRLIYGWLKFNVMKLRKSIALSLKASKMHYEKMNFSL